ncbi:MAG TPA: hypothetical protein VD884_08830 [Ohtaekwangia sp.]|nr:hypothetical protein [Ohtaekwangia sp.]
MKKTLSITLIALLLLNAMGYYAVFFGLQLRNDFAMTERLDTDTYDDAKTVTIKIPVAVPYMFDQTEFVRVDGKFTYDGEFYRRVKQKYAADTLTIICVKDTGTKFIQEALTDYVKTFTDNPLDKHHNGKITVSFIKDFIGHSFSLTNICPGWQAEVIKNGFNLELIPDYTSTIIHPPERG